MANRYLSLEATEVVNAFEECYLNEGAEPIMNTGETIRDVLSMVEASDSLPEKVIYRTLRLKKTLLHLTDVCT